MNRKCRISETLRTLSLAAICLFLLSSHAHAGSFWVSPIRLELDAKTRTGLITVTNNDTDPLHFQVEASSWTQNEKGEDVYSRTVDLNFYPRLLDIKPGESKVIRVGVKLPAINNEKTYRIFIRDLPADDGNPDTSQVKIYMRFGAPVFVKPASITKGGAVEHISLSGGDLSFLLRNSGNIHFKVDQVVISGLAKDGSEKFSHTITGWYLLNGGSRAYKIAVPQEQCSELTRLNIMVTTDLDAYSGSIDVDASMCN